MHLRLTLDARHDVVQMSRVPTAVELRYNGRMHETCCQPYLAFEAKAIGRRDGVVQQFECDTPVKESIVRSIDNCRTTNPVGIQLRKGRLRSCRREALACRSIRRAERRRQTTSWRS